MANLSLAPACANPTPHFSEPTPLTAILHESVRRAQAMNAGAFCKHWLPMQQCADCQPAEPAPKPAAPASASAPQTAQQFILKAAASLPAPFTEAELILAAWDLCPERFGLVGKEMYYPDARRVATCLFGRRGLIAGGKIVRVERGTFRVGRWA